MNNKGRGIKRNLEKDSKIIINNTRQFVFPKKGR